MKPDGARKSLICAIRPRRGGWQLLLPSDAGTFLGHSIRIEFDKVHFSADPDPAGRSPLSLDELSLMESLLEHLPEIIKKCEREFTLDVVDLPCVRDEIANPHIWIDRARLWSDGSNSWTFVIEHGDSDYGWHLEFEGITFTKMWGGD